MKLICKNYTNYTDSLRKLKLENLETRYQKLLYRFSIKSVKHEKMKHLFKLNNKTHDMKTRHTEHFQVIKANTERFQKSSIIQMQLNLNREGNY